MSEVLKEKKMKVEFAPIATIKPYDRNARIHSDGQIQQLCDSITEFGFTNPILVDETGTILGGHGRLTAALKMGLTQVPVIRILHLTADQKRAYVIADNKLGLNSRWDEALLSEELATLAVSDFSLEVTGFDYRELGAMNLFGGSGEEDVIGIGADAGKSRPGRSSDLINFGSYKMQMSPQELEGMIACVKKYESIYGLHQGFIGWLTSGKF